MSEREFVKSIIDVALRLKGSPITESEKSSIIKSFNNKSGSPYERAKSAIEDVIGERLIEETLLLEKAASLNNLQNLLVQMNAAADKWQKTQNK